MSAQVATPSIAHQTGSGSRRQPHRPTTYSGAPTGAYTSTSQPSSTYTSSVAPPPRSSSQRQGTNSSKTSSNPASVSTAVRNSVKNTANGSTTQSNPTSRNQEYDAERNNRVNDRERRAVSTQQPTISTSARNERTTSERPENSRDTARRREERDTGSGYVPAPTPGTRQERVEAERERNGTAVQNNKRETRFGEYILGQTLGEGEFGKVKLGWRRDGGVQVAIKLIRRDVLLPHPNRLSKIHREISILRGLSHPNIVRLHEVVEAERHIGIILEYASGGELFDYILTHRYLKDPPACRLFAQLVSGVGYLHKKGIVHRDLKLENLLLDRNRNIIITDFGFANVFEPKDDISEYEDKLDDPQVMKELEKGVREDGVGRRGDLMATSCGSPCYAAPELVVSDGVYTGRKVDVWSCGVILYAMLAGYLPFDDDPANPEGDNINLLYKYIVSTPLTFPEYVTPHARDLLRRILVPNPRKRADLFEVARHSWLSQYSSVVGLITSSTTSTNDISTTTVTNDALETPQLMRSASVREPSTTTHIHTPPQPKYQETSPSSTTTKTSGDTKRNTVQVEYVSPSSETKRGSSRNPEVTTPSKQRRPDVPSPSSKPIEKFSPEIGSSQGTSQATPPRPAIATSTNPQYVAIVDSSSVPEPAKVSEMSRMQNAGHDTGKLPSPPNKQQQRATSYQTPIVVKSELPLVSSIPPPAMTNNGLLSPQLRPDPKLSQQQTQSYSSSTSALPAPQTSTRPNTGDASATNSLGRSTSVRQNSYSRSNNTIPVPIISQSQNQPPVTKKPFIISNPIPQTFDEISIGQPSTVPTKPSSQRSNSFKNKSHKRANTVGTAGEKVFSKIFGGGEKDRSHPPTSMDPNASGNQSDSSRQSFDQGSYTKDGQKKDKRRFSLIPQNFLHRGSSSTSVTQMDQDGNREVTEAPPSRKLSLGKLSKHDRRPSRTASGLSANLRGSVGTGGYNQTSTVANNDLRNNSIPYQNSAVVDPLPNGASSTSINMQAPQTSQPQIEAKQQQQQQLPPSQIPRPIGISNAEKRFSGTGVQSGKNRRFNEAYEHEGVNSTGNAGSTSAARRVMDFFRKRAIGRSKG